MTRRTAKIGAILGVSAILTYPCLVLILGPDWLKYLVKGISIHFSSPEADALNAYDHGDLRLLGVYGCALSVLGVDESDPACQAHMEADGARGLDGTSACSRGATQWWFQEKATSYTIKYNSVLWEKIRQGAAKR